MAKKPTKSKTTSPPPVVVTEEPVVAGPKLRKKALIERVVAASGAKKKDVKPILEFALEELGKALENGEELQLPPMGKVKVHKHKELANADMYMLKLRRRKISEATDKGDSAEVSEAAE